MIGRRRREGGGGKKKGGKMEEVGLLVNNSDLGFLPVTMLLTTITSATTIATAVAKTTPTATTSLRWTAETLKNFF